MTLKELEKAYNDQAEKRKAKIRQCPKKFKRFWLWIWYLITFPYVWIYYNIRDWRSILIFIIVMLVVGSEVWIPFLLGLILDNAWLLGISAVCEAFWLAPFTPFIPLCLLITIGIKNLITKRKKPN